MADLDETYRAVAADRGRFDDGHRSLWRAALVQAFGRNPRRTSPLDRDQKTHARGWWLAAGDWGGNVTIWDVETGMLHVRCQGGGSRIDALAFSPDGTLLAAGGHGRAQLWDVAGGASLLDLQESGPCLSLAFSPDGRFLASGTAWRGVFGASAAG